MRVRVDVARDQEADRGDERGDEHRRRAHGEALQRRVEHEERREGGLQRSGGDD